MGAATAVVTGGSGFIGAYLTRRLVEEGWSVRVMDTMARGEKSRLDPVIDHIELRTADVRDIDAVRKVCKGADVVFHLAAINGTENFYNHPDLVLDVGLRGALAVVEGARDAGVPDMVVASSAEVYQTPAVVPTDETVALMLPDSLNPRYSYGGSKIVSELIAFNYARDHYRQDAGVPAAQCLWARHGLQARHSAVPAARFRLEGAAGTEKRFRDSGGRQRDPRLRLRRRRRVSGIITMWEKGGHREIYHIGNDQEISIAELAAMTARSRRSRDGNQGRPGAGRRHAPALPRYLQDAGARLRPAGGPERRPRAHRRVVPDTPRGRHEEPFVEYNGR